MALVEGHDCVESWRKACTYISDNGGEAWNLLVRIEEPHQLDETWLRDYNPCRIATNAKSIDDTINWVYPLRLVHRYSDRHELYTRYLRTYDRGKRMGRLAGTWGTYFERLIRFGNKNTNQLERAIGKLQTWQRSKTAFVFHTSDPEIDGPRRIGAPCLQYLELLWRDHDVLDLVTVYRNHDYFEKALGNFLALGQLLRFVCAESGKNVGELVCHSVHADFGNHKSKIFRLLN